jgi:hypothetical protein
MNLGPTKAELIEQARTVSLTERQIDAAVRMWRDPQNWRLVPAGVGKRCLYRMVSSYERRPSLYSTSAFGR